MAGSSVSRGAVALAVMAVMVGVTMGLAEKVEWKWEEWEPATCMSTEVGCFCERVRPNVAIRQPANTWSNYGFVFVGLWVLLESFSESRGNSTGVPLLSCTPLFQQIFGGSLVILGFGSLFYHASMTFVGQWMDVMGMYLIAVFAALYNGALLVSKPHSSASKMAAPVVLVVYLLLNVGLGYMLLVVPEYRRHVFLVIALLVVISCGARVAIGSAKGVSPAKGGYFWMSLLSISLAWGIWWLDLYRIICEPDSLIQGHAAWHFLCALSTFYLYLFFASEKPMTKTK